MPLLSTIGAGLVEVEPNYSRAVADFHTAFNLVLALAFLPLLDPLARGLERLMPQHVAAADPAAPLYLDEGALEAPSIAIGHAAREALRMVDVLDLMIEGAEKGLRMGDREAVASARRSDDVLDRLNGEIKRYLARLDPESLTDDEHLRMEAVLAFSLNLEGAGDVVERNIASFVGKLLKRGLDLTPTDDRTISEAFDAIRINLRSAASILMTGDRRAARVLSQQKAEFRRREAEAIRAHFVRLRDGRDASATEATPLDLLRDIKRLNDHIVAGAAYPVLEAAGDLMQSRIAKDGDDESV